MQSITVRLAESTDYQMLADLGRRAFFEAFRAYNDPDDMQTYLDLAFQPEVIQAALKDPECTFFVAFWNDQPVGYAKLKRSAPPKELSDERAIQLERIYTLQEFIGKKVGKVLMQHCIELAHKEHYSYIWLGVWQQNERAIAFYKKWGFEVIGTKVFVIGNEVNDDYVMALSLAPKNHL